MGKDYFKNLLVGLIIILSACNRPSSHSSSQIPTTTNAIDDIETIVERFNNGLSISLDDYVRIYVDSINNISNNDMLIPYFLYSAHAWYHIPQNVVVSNVKDPIPIHYLVLKQVSDESILQYLSKLDEPLFLKTGYDVYPYLLSKDKSGLIPYPSIVYRPFGEYSIKDLIQYRVEELNALSIYNSVQHNDIEQ